MDQKLLVLVYLVDFAGEGGEGRGRELKRENMLDRAALNFHNPHTHTRRQPTSHANFFQFGR